MNVNKVHVLYFIY